MWGGPAANRGANLENVAYSKGMSPGMAGRTAIVCTLVAWVAIAHADKRRVAVIDLSGDDKAQELAKRIGDELTNHSELQIIFDQTVIGDLMGPYVEENATDLAAAQQMKRLIDDQL